MGVARDETSGMLNRRTLLTSAAASMAAHTLTIEPAAAHPEQSRGAQPERSRGALPPLALSRAVVVRAGRDRTDTHLKLLGVTPYDVKVSTEDSGGALFAIEHREMGKGGPNRHLHFDQDELFYAVKGEFLFEVGDETFRLQAGDSLFAPRRVPHRWACVSDPGTILIALQPAGTMEQFFSTIGALPSRPTPERLAEIFAAHGMQVLGPPFDIR
jgi:quercetin dioxygenase-like cupin family protein